MTTGIQQLIIQLSATDPEKRSQAAEELSHLGPDACQAALALVLAAGDEAEEVRESAVAALEGMGPPKPDTVPDLAALLAAKSQDVGYWAATLLGRLKADAAQAVPALGSALTGSLDLSVRQRVAWALGEIGAPAKPALDSLKQVAADADPRLSRLAQEAVTKIGG